MGFTGVYEKLGIKPIYETPYNARAKVIERFFLDFQESFENLIPSYIGTSIENKPAYLMRNEKLHKNIHEKFGFTPTIEQALKMIEKWLDFKPSQPCPNDKDKIIQEVLNEIEKQNIDENSLDDLMMAQEIKSIGRNGRIAENLHGTTCVIKICVITFLSLKYRFFSEIFSQHLCRLFN